MLKVGVAGYGVVGKRRRECVDIHPNMKMVAICDQYFASKGTMEDGLRYYKNYKQLLGEDLDILIICLTNDIASEVTIAGLESGLHVFCEKPPGRDLKDIVSVIKVEKKYPSLKLKYGFNHRYHQSVKKSKEIIENHLLFIKSNF